MALDQALLERASRDGESWLRLYQWAPHCLSFGRHEPATRRYDSGLIADLGLDTVRRPTGGRAVWHAQELTYAMAAPSRHFGSLRAAYFEIHGMLADALRGLGAEATLARPVRTSPLDSGPCFSQAVGGEIMIEGRKVVGSAQVQQGGALLQHGSILLEDNQGFVLGLMRGASIAHPSPVSDSASGQRGADRWCQSGEVAERISQTAEACWPGEWNRDPDPEPVLQSASALYAHYRSTDWTWVR
jgi:lipoate-protein ligase A